MSIPIFSHKPQGVHSAASRASSHSTRLVTRAMGIAIHVWHHVTRSAVSVLCWGFPNLCAPHRWLTRSSPAPMVTIEREFDDLL